MASIEKRPRNDGRASWRAHYRSPSGEQRNKTFDRKADAERFLSTVESAKNTGAFVDPVLARITVGDWATHWLDNQTHVKPSTHERYAGIVRKHIRPRWVQVRLANVSHADVQRWVTELSKELSPATVRKIHRVLSLILDMAVHDGRMARNVASGVNLPRPLHEEQRHLDYAQVDALAEAIFRPLDVSKHGRLDERENNTYRLVVLFLAYTGVRFGEMAALKMRRLDLARRRAVIAESVTPVQGKGPVWGTPKSHQRREVSIPASWSKISPLLLPPSSPKTWCSPASAMALPCGSRRSAARSRPHHSSLAFPTCTRTSCGTPPHHWPSRRGQTSRLSRRCSATRPRL